MNKLLVLLSFAFLFLTHKNYAQPAKQDKDYIYGRMVGNDTLIGYFFFTREIHEDGLKVVYKRKLGEDPYKTFSTRSYTYFEADSLYMENFQLVQTEELSIQVMIPLIIDGSIQLFHVKLNHRDLFAFKKDDYKSEFDKKSFKRQMAYLLNDDPDLLARVKKGEFGYKDIKQIILLYNESHPLKPADE